MGGSTVDYVEDDLSERVEPTEAELLADDDPRRKKVRFVRDAVCLNPDVAALPENEQALYERLVLLTSDDNRDAFLAELERQMIEGYTYSGRRRWAIREYGVSPVTVSRIESLIKQGWKLSEIHPDTEFFKRDSTRMRFLHVFKRAMELSDLRHAIRALECIAKIDGHLDENGGVAVNVTTGVQIASTTASTRARTFELMARMRELTGRIEERDQIVAERSGGTVVEIAPSPLSKSGASK